MFEKAKTINSLSFKIISKERFGTEYKLVEAFLKIQINPTKIYYKQLIPQTGAEMLINERYRKKALVNPNSFPWINIELNPMGKTMRNNQHHSIYEAGFNYFINILNYLFEKNKSNIHKLVIYKGTIDLQGISCYKIEFNNPSFSITSYTVKETCTVSSLACKLHVCDYHILERNTDYTDYLDKISSGTVLNIPSDYAKKLILLIDKSTCLPIFMEVYDDKGLFEQYRFLETKINPPFTEADFSRNNNDYGFK